MFLQRYIDFVTHYFKAVLIFVALATGIFGYYAQFLGIDASAETLLLENDTDLKLTREVHGRYISPDYLVVAFSPKEYMLSETNIATIKALKDSLLRINGVESITSLLDVPLLESPPMAVSEVVKNVRTLSSPDIKKAMVQKELTSSPLYAKNLVSDDFKTTAILVNLKEDARYTELLQKRNSFIELQQKRELKPEEKKEFEAAKKAFKEYGYSTRDEVHQLIENVRSTINPFRKEGELFLGGVMMIADDMIGFVKNDIAIYGTAIMLIMVLMLWVIFRQVRFVVLPILVSFCAVIITTGVNALMGLEVTVVSSNYVAMQLITTLSLVIHLIVSYREEYVLYPHFSQKELIEITLKRMSVPSVFIILTSVAGFGSLMTCDILPIIDLGTMMNIGVTVSLIAAYLLFPSMMMLFPKKEPVLTFDKAFTLNTIFAQTVEHHGKKIIVIVVAILGFSLVGTTQLVVENSFINYFKKSTEIYQGMQKIDNTLGGTTPLEIVVTFPKIQNKEKKSNTSDELDSFADEFTETDNDAQYWFTAQKMETILKVHDYLVSLPEVGNVSSLGTLTKVGRILKEGKDFDGVELALMYNELPLEFKKILLSPYVNTEYNEARFVVRIVDSNKNLRRNELIKKIQTDLETKIGLKKEDFKLVGMMVLYNNMLQSLFDSQIGTLGLALLSLGAMFLFLFRSLKIAVVALTVNMVPISVIFGIMGIANIPLDIMSITIASIALGITVDNTIHYFYRFREELALDGDYIASMHRAHGTIAFGMFYYSLATIVGFLVLVTSNFIPTLIFGLLTVIVLLVAIVSDLLFSPLLVVTFKPFGVKRG
ncbi:MAG: MMPL family transporter [Sulfurimonas sp.]|uniref:efflux RND transporter permease subunit n=1 Tax=Sulfurimonas sp. TaxID=2022749 RepID=UPI0026398343|nr:MMPL family transporter [Sulfurimonas sp.]MDD2651602.1 MMPL family transporter [Sulfurimonas sp.]MDD3451413.1 MMPL family transporter [Sulfurimonas sp.]